MVDVGIERQTLTVERTTVVHGIMCRRHQGSSFNQRCLHGFTFIHAWESNDSIPR